MTNKHHKNTRNKHREPQHRIEVSRPNQAFIRDLAEYFHAKQTGILNEMVNFLRIENPDAFVEHMKKRYSDPDKQEESPAAAFKAAIER